MNQSNCTAIIFDLDGTLLDTSPGIFGSVRYAETQMQLKPIENSLLSQFVGPPPKEMYKKFYGLSETEALNAVKYHREYGMEKAIYEAKVYEGIPELLTTIRDKGYRIAVATLKKQVIAEKILNIFGLGKYFDIIIGMDEEESLSKKDTIELAMKYTGVREAVMVGDSNYDYLGATEAGVSFIGVAYGFGFKRTETYDFNMASKPMDILDILEKYE